MVPFRGTACDEVMSHTLSTLGSRLVASLAMVILLCGSPVCSCAEPLEEGLPAVAGVSQQATGACCSHGAPKPERPLDSHPAQHDPACPHCQSVVAQTPKVEKLVQWSQTPSSPEAVLETLAFMPRQDAIQRDAAGSDLTPPSSSRCILSLLCTLLI